VTGTERPGTNEGRAAPPGQRAESGKDREREKREKAFKIKN
jgi:hypothetical protein